MARITESRGDKRAHYGIARGTRYRFDEDGIVAWFGGMDKLRELAGIYGVPAPSAEFRNGRWAVPGTMSLYLPCLLELAHRMHRELDLYPFVQELR